LSNKPIFLLIGKIYELIMLISDSKQLGKAIRDQRKAVGLTQLDAAGLCGVGERFLSELERGKTTAELGKVLQVITRLGLRLVLANK
jgi:HTH-type transcriptional regulator/antitoxin HipB